MTTMTIIKIAGLLMMAAGLAFIAVTLLKARKQDTFEAVKELDRIRKSGYTKEHHEVRREDVYKKEPNTDITGGLSRRAKRVLQRMQKEEEEGIKKEGFEPGTYHVEQVVRKKKKKAEQFSDAKETASQKNEVPAAESPIPQKEKKETRPAISEKATDILPDEEATTSLGSIEDAVILEPEKATDILRDTENDTDILPSGSEEATGIFVSEKDTDILPSSEDGTDILPILSEEATDILTSSETDTDILPAAEDFTEILPLSVEGTDILPESEESTAVLHDSETDTDILPASEDGTDILPAEEGTDILPTSEDDTDILFDSESATRILKENRSETDTDIL